MITEDLLANARCAPYDHQRVGVDAIVTNPFFFLADEMGAGKTKQTIDAAQVLFHRGTIDRVIVVAPASVRSVWYEPELGELAKHLWMSTKATVSEYHARTRSWVWGPQDVTMRRMEWVVTNYDFIRSSGRLDRLLVGANQKTLLVLDESSSVKNWTAQQTKACLKLRRKCGRVLLLNGTPIANNPGDLFAQGNILDPRILQCPSLIQFRSRYAVMGGFENRQVVKWFNLEDLQQRFAPYILRRLKEDCLDLPPKMPPVTYAVPMSHASWKLYKEMRADMVAWLSSGTVATAQQATTKILRLGQLTSGFLGGVEAALPEDSEALEQPPLWLEDVGPNLVAPSAFVTTGPVAEVGRDKLDFFLHWFADRIEQDPTFKVIVWTRFRPELERLLREARERFPSTTVVGFYGGQKKAEREDALRAVDPRTAPSGSLIAAGTLGTGAKGLNMTAADHMLDLSFDFSLEKFLQSRDRVHRPGQTRPVNYYEVVATGPDGQKTIDHLTVRARHTKEDLAQWTTSAWVRALKQE